MADRFLQEITKMYGIVIVDITDKDDDIFKDGTSAKLTGHFKKNEDYFCSISLSQYNSEKYGLMPNFEKISMRFNKDISFNESIKNTVSHAFTGYTEKNGASIDEGFFQIPCLNSIIIYALNYETKAKKLS